MNQSYRLTVSIMSAILAWMVVITPCAAQNQSNSELRQENERLRSRIAELEAELKAAQELIGKLQTVVDQMRSKSARTSSHTPPPEAPRVTIDESKPLASPRALLAALIADYHKTLSGKVKGEFGDQDRVAYTRALNRWSERIVRDYKGPIEWHVRVLRSQPQGNDFIFTTMAVDPQTGAELGDSFDLRIDERMMRQLERLQKRNPSEVFVLRGTLSPAVTINEDRVEQGAFDAPRFIGPYTEYGFNIEPRSFAPAPQTKPASQESSSAAKETQTRSAVVTDPVSK